MSVERVRFGATGLQVSRLCFGTGSHGQPSAQASMEPADLARLLVAAAGRGITFWDTALRYGTHPHVRLALQQVARDGVVVATKTHAADREAGRRSVEQALRELGTDYIDIMLMHEVDSVADLQARQGALVALHQARQKGWVRAVGLSTHSIDLLEIAAGHPEIQVLFTNFNYACIHMDADIRHYLAALRRCFSADQGIYVHKTLGEGTLGQDAPRAIRYNLGLDCVHAVCVGLQNQAELDAATAAFRTSGSPVGQSPTGPTPLSLRPCARALGSAEILATSGVSATGDESVLR